MIQNSIGMDALKASDKLILDDELIPGQHYQVILEGTPSKRLENNYWHMLFAYMSANSKYISIGTWGSPAATEALKRQFDCIDEEIHDNNQIEMIFEATDELIAYILETLKTPKECPWFNLACLESLDRNNCVLSTAHFGEECYLLYQSSDEVKWLLDQLGPEDIGFMRIERYERSNQVNAIHKILKSVKKDPAVRAVFLKGSIAKGEDDEFSDVDFYCVVDAAQEAEFLTRRLEHMKKYHFLIYDSEVNHVCPQIVGYFGSNLHFDLYTVIAENIPQTGPIKVLHDPEGLLENYEAKDLSISKNEYWEYFDELAFILVEYEAAFMRGDKVWASRLAQHCSGYVAMIFRYLTDPKQARLGMKRLHKCNAPADHEALSEAMELLGPSSSVKGLNLLLNIVADVIARYPETLEGWEHQYFFEHMHKRIEGLC